ncbi:MAG: hypothetical protein KKD01_19620 [Proteobacteria bacterium]|nr:hypothetical protein [Pseudomonadota bacterium]
MVKEVDPKTIATNEANEYLSKYKEQSYDYTQIKEIITAFEKIANKHNLNLETDGCEVLFRPESYVINSTCSFKFTDKS